MQSGSRTQFENSLNQISWTSEAVNSFQSTIVNGPYRDVCIPQTAAESSVVQRPGLPAIRCPYTARDPCNNSTATPGLPGGGAVTISASLSIIVVVALMAIWQY